MSTLTSAYLRARWLHVPSAILMVLLQRMPILRAMISTEVVVSSGASSVIKGVLASVAAMGAVQTVAGATALNPAAGQTGNPALGTVGQPFTGGFSVVGAPHNAGSYQITGTIPAGLTVTGMVGNTVNASVVTITGTPTEAGSFPLSVRAWRGINRTGDGGNPTFTYTITISAAATTAPAITTQPVSQTVNSGTNVSFTTAASGSPTPTFQWRKDGVAISGATSSTLSLSSVSSADAASYTVVATNSAGSATSSAAVLTVNTVAAPSFTTQPVSQTVNAGANVSFTVAVSGAPTPTLQWRKDGVAISGATASTLSLTGVNASNAGSYTVVATNSQGSATSSAAVLTLNTATTTGLVIVAQPESKTIAPGGSATFSISSASPVAATFQWFRNDVAINGATSSSLALSSLSSANNGRYHVVVTAGSESLQSRDAYLLVATPQPGGVVNESVLTSVKSGDPLTVGFVLSGGSRSMLIRGAGPTLGVAPFNIGGVLAQPKLELFKGGVSAALETNQGWNNNAAIASAAGSVGAFGLTTPNDAAVLRTLDPTPHSAVITSADGSAGLAIVEAYAVPNSGSGRLVNLSALKRIDDSNSSLTAGFSIDGNVPVRLLIRAVGPSLNPFTGGAEINDTTLIINRLVGPNGEKLGVVLENDDWFKEGNSAEILSVGSTAGAFPLLDNAKDAAVLVTLPAGNYTAQVGRKGSASGTALIEVYVAP